jgi:glycosyltransferase involved in cell wall biosynthesis
MSPQQKTKVDLVIPVFNEAGVIEQFYTQISAVLAGLFPIFHIFFVDDGSTDGTADSLRTIADSASNVTVLTLSRNFGHQAALTAGLDASTGDFVISLDGDGQHPPQLIPQMVELFKQGYDIVQAQRIEEVNTFSFKHFTSSSFYALINHISGTQIAPGAADFRGMSRQAVDALKAMPEYHRFLRGMVSWLGYKSVILPYHETQRMAGKSKYSLGKMFRLASDAIFSFSLIPLYIGLSAGGMFFCLAALEMIYVLSFWIKGNTTNLAPGWSSLMFVILIVSGIIMVLLGFIGIYVGYIFQEVKRRPVYLLKTDEKNDNR